MLEARLSQIIEKLEKNGNVEVRQLARDFHVSEKTIRQDLAKMEKKGLLKRVHGGAVSNIRKAEDAYTNTARTIALAAKEKIAVKAYDFVRQEPSAGRVLFIDAGTSNYEFSRLIKNTDFIIITNDLLIASNLSTSSVVLHLTGGKMTNNVNKYLTGSDTVDMINRHNASLCFVGASSISIENGLMTMNDEDVPVKQAMIRNSETVVCLVDHTKFNTTSFVKFADIRDIDIIITDEIDTQLKSDFEAAGIKIITADSLFEESAD